jgi:hypothetical protein
VGRRGGHVAVGVSVLGGKPERGGRCRIRTCDFHRVKVALYR